MNATDPGLRKGIRYQTHHPMKHRRWRSPSGSGCSSRTVEWFLPSAGIVLTPAIVMPTGGWRDDIQIGRLPVMGSVVFAAILVSGVTTILQVVRDDGSMGRLFSDRRGVCPPDGPISITSGAFIAVCVAGIRDRRHEGGSDTGDARHPGDQFYRPCVKTLPSSPRCFFQFVTRQGRTGGFPRGSRCSGDTGS